MLINVKVLQVDAIIFEGVGQACPKYLGKLAMSLRHLEKGVWNEVRDLIVLPSSDTTLAVFYTFNFLPPLNLFPSQYGIRTKPIFHLISCLFNISLLLVSSYGRSMQVSLFIVLFIIYYVC